MCCHIIPAGRASPELGEHQDSPEELGLAFPHGPSWAFTRDLLSTNCLADLSCVPKGHLQGMDLGGTWLGAWGLLLLLHSALWLSLSQEQPRLDNTGHPKLMPKSLMKKQHLRKAEREERGPCTGTWQQAHLKERSNV